MKGLVKHKGQKAAIQEIDLKHNENHVLIAVKIVGICRTDVKVYKGELCKCDKIVVGHEFSGIAQSGAFKGKLVSVNPMYKDKFMGLDFDGAICEFISVPEEYVYLTENLHPQSAAFLEPVAAALAVKPYLNGRCAVIGNNRIAKLVRMCCPEVEVFDESSLYDTLIETEHNDNYFRYLNDNGRLVLKSRRDSNLSLNVNDMVVRGLSVIGASYSSFYDAVKWLENNDDVFELFGNIYPMSEHETAFNVAQQEEKKVFICVA